MDLETAANIGEALGGLAILVTLLFGLRQIRDWNQTRRFEIAQSVASRFENPLFQYGIAVVVIGPGVTGLANSVPFSSTTDRFFMTGPRPIKLLTLTLQRFPLGG